MVDQMYHYVVFQHNQHLGCNVPDGNGLEYRNRYQGISVHIKVL